MYELENMLLQMQEHLEKVVTQWRDQQALYLVNDDRGDHLSASQPAD